MRKAIAATLMALMMVPFIGTAAQASDKVACLFYYTFQQRDPDDYVECFI